MSKTPLSYSRQLPAALRKVTSHPWQSVLAYWRKGWGHKCLICLTVFMFLCISVMYGIARWYIATEGSKPLEVGVSFIPDYAQSLGLNPQQTMDALIHSLNVRNFRLVSYWDDMEPQPGVYNFDQLDWQFRMAESAHAKISLSLGLRQPRWPECHMPAWAENEPASVWEPQLNAFIAAVVNRYKASPSLRTYQLENEYFLQGFGTCTNFSRQRLINEFNLVKKLDPVHTVIMARSNNALGIPLGKPTPDEFGISIYKRVWDENLTHRYLEYPFPAWYYAFLAGLQKIVTGRDMIVHEMQAEPWAPNNKTITEISLGEQSKSLNATRLTQRFKYAEATGMRTIYMWGGEYWYYRLTVEHDSSVWNTAKQAFAQANAQGQ